MNKNVNFEKWNLVSRGSKAFLFLISLIFITGACVEEEFAEDTFTLLSQSGTLGVNDDAHGGNEGLYFLPPMVKQPSFSGTFNSGLSPIVEISEDPYFNSLHASFTMDGTGPQRVRVDREDEHYMVNWKVSATNGKAGKIYRIRVRIGDTILGHADVGVVATGRDKVPTGVHRVVVNQTLPIKFRIEERDQVSRIEIMPGEANILIGSEQQFTATIYDKDNMVLEDKTVHWKVSDENIASIDNNGLAKALALGSVIITASVEGVSATATLNVQELIAPPAGIDVVVFNDVNVFDNTAFLNPNNQIMMTNIINYTAEGFRASGSKVWFDCGRNSSYPWACSSTDIITSFHNLIRNYGYTLEMISSSSGYYSDIPSDVKLIFLWLPTVSYTVDEINAFKKFASEGGRIVFVGEHDGFYPAQGLAVENQFLLNMGAFMRNVGQAVDCQYTLISQASLRPHQITIGMSEVLVACASVIELGPNDYPLFYDTSNTYVLAGVATIDTTPINELKISKVNDQFMNMRKSINSNATTISNN